MTTPLSRDQQIAENIKAIMGVMDPIFTDPYTMRKSIDLNDPDSFHLEKSLEGYPDYYADALACKYVLTKKHVETANIKALLRAAKTWYLIIPAIYEFEENGVYKNLCPVLTDKHPFSVVESAIDAQIDYDHHLDPDHVCGDYDRDTWTYILLTDDDSTAALIKLSM